MILITDTNLETEVDYVDVDTQIAEPWEDASAIDRLEAGPWSQTDTVDIDQDMKTTTKTSRPPTRSAKTPAPCHGSVDYQSQEPGQAGLNGAMTRTDPATRCEIENPPAAMALLEPEPLIDRRGKTWRIHPLAALMPPMRVSEYSRLKDSIQETGGNLVPIVLSSSEELLDGRHRPKACIELEIEPRTAVWDGAGSEIDVVVGLNDRRRQLKKSQRALIAAKLTSLPRGRPKGNAQNQAFSQKEIAAKLGISRSYVQTACVVLDRAIPALIYLIDRDELSLAAANQIAELDHAEQERLAELGMTSIRSYLRETGARRKGPGRDEHSREKQRTEAVAEPQTAFPTDLTQSGLDTAWGRPRSQRDRPKSTLEVTARSTRNAISVATWRSTRHPLLATKLPAERETGRTRARPTSRS